MSAGEWRSARGARLRRETQLRSHAAGERLGLAQTAGTRGKQTTFNNVPASGTGSGALSVTVKGPVALRSHLFPERVVLEVSAGC